MLEVKNLHTYYGSIHALKGINMNVQEGEIVSLVGANGAGKSTLVNTIAGILKPKEGNIIFDDNNIGGMDAYKIVKKGISLSPEGREVFPTLTVEENLRLGAFIVNSNKEISNSYDRCYELFPKLKVRKNQQAGTLSGGEQQMLAIARALMNSPRLLLLDEPSLGLAPNIVIHIFNLIMEIAKQGTTILLIEQNASMALQISDRAYVMENGKVSMEGKAFDIARDERIKKIYLGA